MPKQNSHPLAAVPPAKKPGEKHRPKHRAVVLAYDGLCTFEFGIAVEFFGLPRPELDVDWYDFSVAGLDPNPMRATGGVYVMADGGLELFESADTIVIPGWKGIDVPPPERLVTALKAAHMRGCRLMTICSGVFVLAQCGLLDGRRATTHWRYTDILQSRYPKVQVEPGILYADDGNVLTSAGSAAGIDLCMHVIRQDHGPDIANRVARRMVVQPHRDGGQAQFIDRPVPRAHEGARLGGLFDWMREHLDEGLPISRLAKQAGMSQRTFLRRFQEATGTAPGDWLTTERLRRARDLLETRDMAMEDVAEACGFGSAATLRHHFRERFGTSPTAYRSRFRQAG